MGLFSKFKELISKKEKIVEDVKEELNVENLDEIEEVEEDIEIEEQESIEEVVEDEEQEEFVDDDIIEEEQTVEEIIEEPEDEEIVEESVVEEKTDITEEPKKELSKKELKKELKKAKKDAKKAEKIKQAQEIDLYDKGLEKTRREFVSKLSVLGIKYTKIDDEYYDELEELLINADIGVNTVFNFMERLRDRVKEEHITDTEYLNEVIVDELLIIYVNNEYLSDKINLQSDGPTVLLMVGVNGVGKTTTIGKLANKYKNEGKKVMLIAGDTFRAGAVPQLEEWARRTDSIFYGKENSDPAGVIYDGLVKAKEENVDIVLIDTAGRLQNKVNLMNELAKINKVIATHIPNAPHETLLVIDATTGQNGISQATAFKEITDITGIVLTKLDGTAKGGIVLAIKEAVNIPVKFVGLGEGVNDLKTFDIENYIYGLFKDMM